MVGLIVGAGLVWFVVAEQRRREVDIDAEERAREALWLSATLADEGEDVSPSRRRGCWRSIAHISRRHHRMGGRHGHGWPVIARERAVVRAAR